MIATTTLNNRPIQVSLSSVDVALTSSAMADTGQDAPGLKSLSIASAPVLRTGRSSRRYTTSVVLVLEWPAIRAISSTGTPELDISDTNE